MAVAGPTGSVGVFARGVNDELVRWWSDDGDSWTGAEHLGGPAFSGPPNDGDHRGGDAFTDPAAVLRLGGEGPDVVVAGADREFYHWGPIRVDPFSEIVFAQRWRRIRGVRVIGQPVIVSWGPDRLDVIANLEEDGVATMGHLGRKGFNSDGHKAQWFGTDPLSLGDTRGAMCVVATAPGHAEAFGRDGQHRLVRWSWDFEPGTFVGDQIGWTGPVEVHAGVAAVEIGSQPAAAVRGRITQVYAWDGAGANLLELTRQGDTWTAHTPTSRGRAPR